MSTRWALLLATLAACQPDQPPFSVTWEGLDTLSSPGHAVGGTCTATGGLVLEGVADSLSVLLLLSSDTAGVYEVGVDGVTAVASRMLPSRMEGWVADSGLVRITASGLEGLEGFYDVWLRDARVRGGFGPIATLPDSLACEVQDSIGAM